MHLYTDLALWQLIIEIMYAFVYQSGHMAVNHGDCVCICIPIWRQGN